MNKYDSETIDYFRENPLVQDIKERIRQLAIEDKQEGAQDRYIFEEPSSFMQRERTCAKYIGKVSTSEPMFKVHDQIKLNCNLICNMETADCVQKCEDRLINIDNKYSEL